MRTTLLLGCLLVITACQPAVATPTPGAALFPTSTPVPSPTPIVATLTPEATFTPGPTSTPFPRLFTQEFDASLEGWVILQAGNQSVPTVTTEGGSLVLQMDQPNTWLYALYGAQDYADVRVDTQFINRALTPASAGLICRYSDTAGWLEFNLSTDGSYNLLAGKWLDVGVPEYLPIVNGIVKDIQPTGALQSMGLGCAGATAALYVNDILFRQVEVSRYVLTEGKVGLTAASHENVPIVIGFERVTVAEP